MTLRNFRFEAPVLAHNFVSLRLNQLQTDLVTTARNWAMDEMGAAISHQLGEPLTALLLYLHEIKKNADPLADSHEISSSLREMIDNALQEAERLCEIMARLGHALEPQPGAEPLVALGGEVVDLLSLAIAQKGKPPIPSHSAQHTLTPRESEVLALIVEGASNKVGGHRLGISTRTFEVHRARIMAKLGARNAADLVRMALSEAR